MCCWLVNVNINVCNSFLTNSLLNSKDQQVALKPLLSVGWLIQMTNDHSLIYSVSTPNPCRQFGVYLQKEFCCCCCLFCFIDLVLFLLWHTHLRQVCLYTIMTFYTNIRPPTICNSQTPISWPLITRTKYRTLGAAAAPTLLNLPSQHFRNSSWRLTFKSQLKTHFFKFAFHIHSFIIEFCLVFCHCSFFFCCC